MSEIPIRQLAKIIAGAIIAVLIFFILGIVSIPIMDLILDWKAMTSIISFINVPKLAIKQGSAHDYYLSLEGPQKNIVVGTFCKNETYQQYIESWKKEDKNWLTQSRYQQAKQMCTKGYCFCLIKLYYKENKNPDWENIKPFVIGDDYGKGLLDKINSSGKIKKVKVLTCVSWPTNENGDPYKLYVNVDVKCKKGLKVNWLLCLALPAACFFTAEETETDCSKELQPVIGILPYKVSKSILGFIVRPVEFQDIYAEVSTEEAKVYMGTIPYYPSIAITDFSV